MTSRSRWITFALIVFYALGMAYTNNRFTILDDESTIVAVAGHPILPTLELFLAGGHQHEHPPVSDILLHVWLVATHFSFFALRLFANVFFIAGAFFTSRSAHRLAREKAYWGTLILCFVWPFAFQYGRITGWYAVSMFLVALLTWLYLRILEDQSPWLWASFVLASILLLWSNYFGVALLFLLFLDLIIFHRQLAIKNSKPLLISTAIVATSFVPLLRVVLANVKIHAAPVVSHMDWKGAIAAVGYPVFSIFGSAAVAPWFLPLSIPVFLSTIALLVAIWFSSGRKWLVYFFLAMILLELSGHMNIKRVLFLLPWLFLAIGVAASSARSHYPWLASAAVAVMVIAGWIGIVSGKHYATTNLYEPWERVAQMVSDDARHGATVISENPPFFLYLDYQLGLEAETGASQAAYLGEALYRSHGYTILEPDDRQPLAEGLRGRVVLVNGSGDIEHVQWTNRLNDRLRQRCTTLGQYRAAPDPAAALKQQFARNTPVLAYRVDVTWYDCSDETR